MVGDPERDVLNLVEQCSLDEPARSHHELERQQVLLLVANMPGARIDGATGRYMYGQLCLAAQLQRDLDSERMTRMQHGLFEDGRHRGHDPFGYRSRRDPRATCAIPATSSSCPLKRR
ncbi:MAG: hypothetical protein ACRDGQ_08550 [Candidatus Limnocylindrales bacterium]